MMGNKTKELYKYDQDNTTTWLIGRPTRLEVTEITPAGDSQTRTTGWGYDGTTGLVNLEEIEPDSTDRSIHRTTQWWREDPLAPGLVTKIVSSAVDPLTGFAMQRSSTIAYDIKLRQFPALVSNSLNHYVAAVYHAGLGMVVASMDVNGVRKNAGFDLFGRLQADARQQSRRLDHPGETDGGLLLQFDRELRRRGDQRPGLPDDLEDRLNRAIRADATVSGRVGTTAVRYDELGYLRSQAVPWNGNPALGATEAFADSIDYRYDERGRLLSV